MDAFYQPGYLGSDCDFPGCIGDPSLSGYDRIISAWNMVGTRARGKWESELSYAMKEERAYLRQRQDEIWNGPIYIGPPAGEPVQGVGMNNSVYPARAIRKSVPLIFELHGRDVSSEEEEVRTEVDYGKVEGERVEVGRWLVNVSSRFESHKIAEQGEK